MTDECRPPGRVHGLWWLQREGRPGYASVARYESETDEWRTMAGAHTPAILAGYGFFVAARAIPPWETPRPKPPKRIPEDIQALMDRALPSSYDPTQNLYSTNIRNYFSLKSLQRADALDVAFAMIQSGGQHDPTVVD